jgi:hypothetical protein
MPGFVGSENLNWAFESSARAAHRESRARMADRRREMCRSRAFFMGTKMAFDGRIG